MSDGMGTGFRIPLVILRSPFGPKFYNVNETDSKVIVKIKWENTYKNVNLKAEAYSPV